MQTKLTLRLEEKLIERAKRYAEASGKSVSQIVADYFAVLDSENSADKTVLLPITRSLSGVLKDKDVNEQNYYDYLEEKYL